MRPSLNFSSTFCPKAKLFKLNCDHGMTECLNEQKASHPEPVVPLVVLISIYLGQLPGVNQRLRTAE